MSEAIVIESSAQFLSFIKDEVKGNGNLSIRGVARCCGVEDTSIVRGAAFASEKLAQKLEGEGFQGAALVENGFSPKAVWLCIEYFAYDSKAKAPRAKQLARTFGSIGVMTTLASITEPTVRPQAPALPLHIEAREISECILAIHENLADIDPRFAQILMDRAMQTAMPLAIGPTEPKLSGVVEMAEVLGYRVGKEQGTLGKEAAKAWRNAYGTEPQAVKRECGGAMRSLKVYPSDDPVIIATIKGFYSEASI